MATQTQPWTHVLPTFLPDGREVDVRYCYEPAEPGFYSPDPVKGAMYCPAQPASVEIWEVVGLDDKPIALPPEVLKGLEAECRADVEAEKERRRRAWWR